MTEKSNKVQLETLLVDETPYATELTTKYKNRKTWSPPDNRKVTAFLPGTVTHVLVKEGDLVKEGQTVVKFEAMKMVNNVQTLVAGKVKDVYVKVGDRFPKGFVLVELE
ncbi:MAG: biotin/lipoyl-binding protein [Bacteroidales bacterium]|jgi:biotin carboxyl carrier protein|nr:biotin/lipoyl-binding protein [Bacteroidales bacterium]